MAFSTETVTEAVTRARALYLSYGYTDVRIRPETKPAPSRLHPLSPTVAPHLVEAGVLSLSTVRRANA